MFLAVSRSLTSKRVSTQNDVDTLRRFRVDRCPLVKIKRHSVRVLKKKKDNCPSLNRCRDNSPNYNSPNEKLPNSHRPTGSLANVTYVISRLPKPYDIERPWALGHLEAQSLTISFVWQKIVWRICDLVISRSTSDIQSPNQFTKLVLNLQPATSGFEDVDLILSGYSLIQLGSSRRKPSC